MSQEKKAIALEARLRNCRNVVTLGVHPNFCDYTPRETDLILDAQKIYYPTDFYADLFDTAGKKTFPSYHTYKCVQDKIKQTTLFNLLGIRHPKTRIFYGKRQKSRINKFFQFPFIGKVPRGSAMGRGVFLIHNQAELDEYCDTVTPAYIQEYLPVDRDIRVVVIGYQIVAAYWRIAAKGEFRSNVALGGRISFHSVPDEATQFALSVARQCKWDDVGIDVCFCQGRYFVLEGNMKYGKQGLREAGIDYSRLMEGFIKDGII